MVDAAGQMFDLLDTNKDGDVSLPEFLRFMSKRRKRARYVAPLHGAPAWWHTVLHNLTLCAERRRRRMSLTQQMDWFRNLDASGTRQVRPISATQLNCPPGLPDFGTFAQVPKEERVKALPGTQDEAYLHGKRCVRHTCSRAFHNFRMQ